MEKLTSIRLQPMININDLDTEMWTPVLNFGRKKSGRYRFPIILKNYRVASKLYDELEKFKGKTLEEVKKLSKPLYNKYKRHHYKSSRVELSVLPNRKKAQSK